MAPSTAKFGSGNLIAYRAQAKNSFPISISWLNSQRAHRLLHLLRAGSFIGPYSHHSISLGKRGWNIRQQSLGSVATVNQQMLLRIRMVPTQQTMLEHDSQSENV